ncbi:MAG TPA: ATP-binding protein [Puia sp.]|nr:ATP-binding protein [Puia sp.]
MFRLPFLVSFLFITGAVLAQDSSRIQSFIERSKAFAAAQPDSAVDYCYQGMRLAEREKDLKGQALILLQLSRINALHHHLELARQFANEALSIFRNLGDKKDIALTYDELGLLDGQANNLAAATADLNRSMKFYEDTSDNEGIALTYHNLGSVYEEKGQVDKALSYYLRSLIQYEHRSLKTEDYFTLLDEISRLYMKKGDRHAALHYLEKGVQGSDTPLLRDTEINLLEEEGKLVESNGDKREALFYYKKELNASKKAGSLEGQASALASIGRMLKKDSTARSLVYLREALVIVEHIRKPELKATIYEALAAVYQQQKNYREAMLALEEHDRLLDSLLLARINSDIVALDTSYRLEKSREEIDQLQETNKKGKAELRIGFIFIIIVLVMLVFLWMYLRKAKGLNRELLESNHVRDTLFSIVGHDLKGPAGNAVKLLEIMEAGSMPADVVKKMTTELRKQSAASLELLNALFEWGKAQLHGVEATPASVGTKPIVEKNISLLAPQAALKNIVITDDTPAELQVYADPNHVDFIIRNLLSNAIKFTHDRGRIELQAVQKGKDIVFSVRDNGIGISKEKQDAFLKTTLPVSFGTKGEKGSGLGLLLIKEFVRANKGHIWLESKEKEGTVFYVSFPMAY